jgi:hypothetical protein
MSKRRRSRYQGNDRNTRNFSDASSTAITTANLVSLLDPAKIGDEEIEVISKATGAEEEFVEGLVDLVDQTNIGEIKGADEELLLENFSRHASNLVAKYSSKRHKNFSAGESSLSDTIEIINMLDDDAMDCCSSTEIADTISEATGEDAEVVEAIVELAQNNFSIGKKFGFQSARKINRKNFSVIDVEVPNSVEQRPVQFPDDEAFTSSVPEQKPALEEADPTPENPVTVNADPVGEAMMIQNDLATVIDAASVPEGDSNFSRKNVVRKPNGTNFSTLKSVLGDAYIPN